jgi:hypothetical protein
MSHATLNRRVLLTLASRALLGAGALAVFRPDRARGDGDTVALTGQDRFDRLVEQAREHSWADRPIGERTGAVGMALRQTPYVDGTLELHEDREVCSVNLRGLDCVTFFESALAFARMLGRGGRTPEALLAEVTFTRYRGGRLTDYASRLHYMSDWFADNDDKRVVRLITRELPGAARFTKRVNFMSTHPAAYRQLKANPEMIQKITRVEAVINARTMHYLPKDKVAAAGGHLMTGDIVGITTTIDGLDCAHAGLCYRDEGGALRLLHASTARKAVLLDENLAAYLARVPTHTGIMAARPLEARAAVP